MSDIQSAVRIESSSYKCEKGVKYVDKALFSWFNRFKIVKAFSISG